VSSPAHKITAGELVLVCSRYDLGAIQSLRRLRGGSRESPKVLVASDRGRFLIKRRPPRGEDLSHRVALSHEVQLHLAARGFPIAPLVGTRTDNNSLLELNGFIYEVFRFVDGHRYERTPAEAHAAGRLLAVAHRLLSDLHPRWTPPDTTYHNHPAVAPSIADLISRTSDAAVRDHLAALRDAYLRASSEAERLGALRHPAQLIHADWHPGNLLFAAARSDLPAASTPAVAAVLDFDSVRTGRPIMDLANGALQFAVARRPGGGSAASGGTGIRVSLSPELVRAFCVGYQAEPVPSRLQAADMAVIPWLMIEAIVVETIAPIAATGQFGNVSAAAAVAMTRQATDWMATEANRLVSLASGL
jgi:Ser/Thr protein kinase RdoA (MazF antagonist)